MKKSAKKPTLTGSSISSAYLKASSTSHVKSASAVQPKSAPPKAKKPLKPEHMPQPRPPRRSSPPPDQPPRRSDNLPAFGTSVRLASRASKKNTSASARNDFVLPAVPSRAPSPPTKVVAGTNGNKFTAEDKVFFIEHLMYELNRDPSLTKSNLCTSLAAKVGIRHYRPMLRAHHPHRLDTTPTHPGVLFGTTILILPTRSLLTITNRTARTKRSQRGSLPTRARKAQRLRPKLSRYKNGLPLASVCAMRSTRRRWDMVADL